MDKISHSLHIRGVTLPRVQPIIPTWRKEPFDHPEWLFDFKYDGFRALCYIEQGHCRFISRNGNVLSRFESLGNQVAATLHIDPYDTRVRWLKIKNPDYSQREGRTELFNRAKA